MLYLAHLRQYAGATGSQSLSRETLVGIRESWGGIRRPRLVTRQGAATLTNLGPVRMDEHERTASAVFWRDDEAGALESKAEADMATARLISGSLQVERLDDGKRKLLRDLEIDLGAALGLGNDEYPGFTMSAEGHTIVTVPKDFVTDFSSIPTFARAFFRFDSVDLAGCCHDWAYREGVPRGVADEVWRLVATSGTRRVGKVRGRVGWLALRIGGWVAYHKHEKRRQERLDESA